MKASIGLTQCPGKPPPPAHPVAPLRRSSFSGWSWSVPYSPLGLLQPPSLPPLPSLTASDPIVVWTITVTSRWKKPRKPSGVEEPEFQTARLPQIYSLTKCLTVERGAFCWGWSGRPTGQFISRSHFGQPPQTVYSTSRGSLWTGEATKRLLARCTAERRLGSAERQSCKALSEGSWPWLCDPSLCLLPVVELNPAFPQQKGWTEGPAWSENGRFEGDGPCVHFPLSGLRRTGSLERRPFSPWDNQEHWLTWRISMDLTAHGFSRCCGCLVKCFWVRCPILLCLGKSLAVVSWFSLTEMENAVRQGGIL